MTDFEFRKVPPQQIEAEQSLLGGILNDNSGIPDVLEALTGTEFYKESHRQIFQAIKDLHGKKEPADIVTVTEWLFRKNQLEAIGGASYLAVLTDWVVSSRNAAAYARIVKEKADLRRLIQNANEVTNLSYSSQKDPKEILQLLKGTIDSIESGPVRCESPGYDMQCGMPEMIEQIGQRMMLKGKIPGLATGFDKLDKITCGMWPQDLWVLAARPGQGKTALSLNITRNLAREGVHVLWFSLDMSRNGLWERLLSTESRINLAKIRSGNMTAPEYGEINDAALRMQHYPITILDSPCTERDVIRQTMTIKPALVVIDHLTKIQPSNKTGNANYDFGNISKEIKNMAKSVDIPVLLLCQLTRQNERENRPPKESDLRDSGEIEQDADTIIFIHSKDKKVPERELIIAKQRQGELAILDFWFSGGVQEFVPKEANR